MTDDIDKYLDPEQNLMIARIPDAEFKEPLKVGDPFFDPDGRAPMMDIDAIKPEELAEKLTEAYPTQNEALIGQTTFVKMTDGSWTEKKSGKPIGELPLGDLLALSEFLNERNRLAAAGSK